MNKQQLASKIWTAANKMRSKIEANEYKDYILGFIFYKFLSDKEESFFSNDGMTKDDMKIYLVEKNENMLKHAQKNLGYFIAYNHLFSTWINNAENNFSVSVVKDALSAFSRLINKGHEKVFKDIFKTLDTGISNLGSTDQARTKAISDLIFLINDIPMDGKQDYDVLGFVYEYLISNFAANAGKKAGEFYTPHEVSFLMSEIVAEHLKDKDKIEIYDPTSGSGSLLINIGRSVAKHIKEKNKIKYYAQELKENTYNLTRMNLVMRGILPDNIFVRNGDTLEEDWPITTDENGEIKPLYVDAVVSNPPYSQSWDSKDKDNDPRYKGYGVAPKSKADYAFLLHDLFHVKPDGIMTIVLPHGVLFRGGSEADIRKNLIEKNNIDTIIGLPANIFFGTGIPTIIMVLKQKRTNTDVLIIDASKGFIKVGKNNKLQESDIKKIVDTVKNRISIPKYSKVVSKDEIRQNDYNLNIPRYVDSSNKVESFDIYATMFGGIPNEEIDELNKYWDTFPSLKNQLFTKINDHYSSCEIEDIKSTIENNEDVLNFVNKFNGEFNDFSEYLNAELIKNLSSVIIAKEENNIANNIFERLQNIKLIDKYKAYQLFNDNWHTISQDIEVIQTDGLDTITKVVPNNIIKKIDDKEVEVPDGFKGVILPFELVQEKIFNDKVNELQKMNNQLSEYDSYISEIIENLSDEEKEKDYLNDDNTAFKSTELNKEVKLIYNYITNSEIECLQGYVKLLDKKASKDEQLAYINENKIDWSEISPNKNGTFSKTNINKRIASIKNNFKFSDDSIEQLLMQAKSLLEKIKTLKSELKMKNDELHKLTKNVIENLTFDSALKILDEKWNKPIIDSIRNLPNLLIKDLVLKVNNLKNKYKDTLLDIETDIEKTTSELNTLIDDLTGNDFDMKGLQELKKLLGGE